MSVGRFEKDPKKYDTLRKLYSAKQYEIRYKYMDKCQVKQEVLIDIKLNRNLLTPIDRASYKWHKKYNKSLMNIKDMAQNFKIKFRL